MAGEQHNIATVQAAIMKQAAGKASQHNPALGVNPTSHAWSADAQPTAITQDLGVMADQAKGYTAGILAGESEATTQATATAARQAEARAQEDAKRAAQVELERMQEEALRLRQEAQAQDAAQRIAEINAAAAARARSGGGGGGDAAEAWLAQTEEAARQVRLDYLTTADPYTSEALDTVIGNAASYGEAMALFNAGKRNNLFSAADNQLFSAYARSYFGAMGSGQVSRPDMATIARGRVMATTRAAMNTQRQREAQPTYVNRSGGSWLGRMARSSARKRR